MATLLGLRAGPTQACVAWLGLPGRTSEPRAASRDPGGGALSEGERSGPGPPKSLASEDQPSMHCGGSRGGHRVVFWGLSLGR